MRIGFLAALTVLLAGHGLAFGQQPPTSPPPNVFNPGPVSAAPYGDGDAQAQPCGLWGSGEYLMWWFKTGRVPPLVTAGGNGTAGSPGTRVVVDNLDFDDNFRQGGRFALGYHFDTSPSIGVEADYFFLSARQSEVSFASGGAPVLGRPFINVATGRPELTLVAIPGTAAGSVTVGTRTSLWGAEGNLTSCLVSADTFHLAAVGGFRFLKLEDRLRIGEQFLVAPDVPGFGGSAVGFQDEFRTVNRFYGGQVGLETGVRLGLLAIDFRSKIALGEMHQGADVNGATVQLKPDGSVTIFQGGLLALRSNIGRHQRDELAFLPELGLTVGLQLTRQLKLYAGYSFLWVSTVARAGEQIDPVVNVTQFPILSGNGPLAGPARPAFNFSGTDFWAQGLNLGLELRY
jgi:hypothetical protein